MNDGDGPGPQDAPAQSWLDRLSTQGGALELVEDLDPRGPASFSERTYAALAQLIIGGSVNEEQERELVFLVEYADDHDIDSNLLRGARAALALIEIDDRTVDDIQTDDLGPLRDLSDGILDALLERRPELAGLAQGSVGE